MAVLKKSMDIVDYTDEFFAIEEKLRLFDCEINGVYWWDAIRHDFYYYIFYQIAGIKLPAASKKGLGRRLLSLLSRVYRKIVLQFKIVFFDYDVLVFRAPRKKIVNRLVDPTIDAISDLIKNQLLVIDTFPYHYHRDTSKKINLIVDENVVVAIKAELSSRFGIALDVCDFINEQVSLFCASIQFYKKFLRKVRPKLILITQNGVEKGLFTAAKAFGIPAMEVQHGLINYVHPLYSYNPRINYEKISSFPSHLLTYSDFWSATAFLPKAKKITVGRKEDERDLERCACDTSREYDYIFISANIYDDILKPLAKKLAEIRPICKIGYKLHPNQVADEAKIRAEFVKFDNVTVLDCTEPIEKFLIKTQSVVAIQSTVVYEALQEGKWVYLVSRLDYRTHMDIFFHSRVIILDDDLNFPVPPPSQFDLMERKEFFRSFDQRLVQKILDDEFNKSKIV